ncbi:hypothetical protein CK203_071918 [Vitis vinifera]|nr:hypothetical protein CK203_071918 [Vitis vinifera]
MLPVACGHGSSRKIASVQTACCKLRVQSNLSICDFFMYVLKKRFGRGSYGEVWLAFPWNCSQGADASNESEKKKVFSFNTMHLDSYNGNSQTNSSTHNCHAGPSDDNLFILKRIMVQYVYGCMRVWECACVLIALTLFPNFDPNSNMLPSWLN